MPRNITQYGGMIVYVHVYVHVKYTCVCNTGCHTLESSPTINGILIGKKCNRVYVDMHA